MTVKILHHKPICSFDADWLKEIINQQLTFEPWDPTQKYPHGTLFYLNCLEFMDARLQGREFARSLTEMGFKVVVDNLWEADIGAVDNIHKIITPVWFWLNESLWYSYRGHDQYRPQKNVQYRGLMPMRQLRDHRSDLIERINLSGLIWSYVEQGRTLPDDGDHSDWETQRFMNPSWYNQTYASIVVETAVDPINKYTPIFITEKTMKPLAYFHPFVLYGNRGTLRTLKCWGFCTFDNLWDESYDEIVNVEHRRDAVIQIANNLSCQNYDQETLLRIEHNHNHFFDLTLVKSMLVKEIIEPIIEYAETR